MDINVPVEPALEKLRLRAEEYRARASQASAAARDATLDRVREQHQTAADTWTDLACAEDGRLASRLARIAEGAK
ncbi:MULTISPECIES: hypothetical protein [unclassified Phenylobacterium]|jgi:hypothetical protein|uniref:hypothetical protein n=1 Tax=unclassified Phenylobacterium TaxID=2640670 RepID=UPI0022B49DD1|nr:hypothetical protein [Phenylobacterium sp. NIBR 498073]WGU41513.1 hypothetical protein O4N75_07250 [Phenylobacterium sp. NIBR 498073]